MIRKHKRIRQHDILPPPRRENHHLGDIIARQRLDTLIHLLRLVLVAVKAHDAELGLDLARVDLDDADARRDEFLAERLGERAHGGFGCAVDAAALVGLAAGDGPDVDDVAAAAVGAGLEDGEDGLRHVDEAGDVGVEHDGDVCGGDVGGLGDALDEAAG